MKKQYLLILLVLNFIFFSCRKNQFEAVRFYISSGNINKAELILNNISKKQKNTFEFYNLKGILYTKKSISGYKRDALNSFIKANEFNSNDYFNNLMIAKMFMEVNSLDDAEIYANKAEKLSINYEISKLDDDYLYLLAKIYNKKKVYIKALESLNQCNFQDDENVLFLKTKISDLQDNKNNLNQLYEKLKIDGKLTDKLKLEYINYLFEKHKISEASCIINEIVSSNSSYLNYYGLVYKAFICLLNKNYEGYRENMEKSYNYTIDDSECFRYKIRTFFSYITESDPIKISNSFLIYKFFYEKNEQTSESATDDLGKIREYFKDDVLFNILKQNFKK